MRPKVISPARAVILTCAAISLILPSVASTTYGFVFNDLLAHPQYKVKRLPPVAASEIGAERLQRGNDHHKIMQSAPLLDTINQPEADQVKEPSDSGNEGRSDKEDSPATTMFMRRPDGQQWVCSIPQLKIVEVPEAPPKTAQELAEEERGIIRRGLALLDHLSGRCLYSLHIPDYWTYEYCHKKSIRQYHAVIVNQQIVPEKKELTFVCGKYEQPSTEVHGHPGNEGSLQQRETGLSAGTVTELKENNGRKYLVQRWTDGDECDLTGQKRTIEVQFQCAPHVLGERIQVVTEEKSCTYIMVIYSRSLCAEVSFDSVPAPEANNIDCRPIISDNVVPRDENLLPPAAVPEAIDGGLAEMDASETKAKAQATFTIDDIVKRLEEMPGETHRSQDSILAEMDAYLQALKPLMTEAQRENIQKIEDYLHGKDRIFKFEGHDVYGEAINLDTFFKPIIIVDGESVTTGDDPKTNQASEQKKRDQAEPDDTDDPTAWATRLIEDLKKKAELGQDTEKLTAAQEREIEELMDLIFGLDDSAEAAGSTGEKATREETKDDIKKKQEE
ncbi:protein OS-9 [Entomortierella parvispora]|uniref:Protein OS-9 homolog n=1 Tax=Entomortierella parvispora TaxID=205924 RepID=A0A9P3HMP6_9FUNG|nr:protein OS-9 [Entomortierella parvispora]